MESLIREGCFDALLDVTTTELADHLCGGICSAGEERMNAAAEMGEYFGEKLEGLKKRFSVIKEIRGMALMRGVELTESGVELVRLEPNPDLEPTIPMKFPDAPENG